MRQTSLESFIRAGGSKALVLRTANKRPCPAHKQDDRPADVAVRDWVNEVWSRNFGATAQAILKTKPFEFSPADLSDLDQEALRADAVSAILAAMEREGFDPTDAEGEQRALAVLFGFLNQHQQEAMGIDFYVWTTQHDAHVRGSHAERDVTVFRWDEPPEGGHPSQDYGCRCYARALGIEGYWERVSEGVETFIGGIEDWEDSVDHMYLDTNDNVTVGIGTLLPDAESAAALAFRDRASGDLASAEDIRAEFDIIDAMDGSTSRRASYYEQFTELYLPSVEISRLVREHVRNDFDELLTMFPAFGNFPLSAQVALWDMIYNLGPEGLRRGFPRMRQAIEDGDWEEAARQSHRLDIGEGRNDFVFNLFMDAAEGR
ncbi:MAG: phage minor head protein [Paracoccaceae bacterium]